MQFSTHRPFYFLLQLCFITALLFGNTTGIKAQGTLEIAQVPDQMTFAGIKIKLDQEARNAVQKKVNGLMRSPSFYQGFVERCNIFFPLIESVFKEENLPADFRFLALQESALIADAVSRSNAVGFWQFKEATARELGLLVDKDIDERKNVILASRAAAKYLKKNNYFMKNWVYSLLSYNLGLTGANNLSDRSKIGASEMDLDGETHPYIIHFLAHKIAFENTVGKDNSSDRIKLVEYPDAADKTFTDIAKKSGIEPELLEKYNRWLSGDKVPSKAKDVPFLLPTKLKDEQALIAKLGIKNDNDQGGNDDTATASSSGSKPSNIALNNGKYPIIKGKREQRIGGQKVTMATANGIDAVIPDEKTDMPTLIGLLKISRNKFMKYNDMNISSELTPSVPYYLKKKKSKTPTDAEFHVTQYGESLWDVSQIYGIKEKSLRKKNRMATGEEPKPGRVLWLKKNRPRSTPIEVRDIGPEPKKQESTDNTQWEVSDKKIEEILTKEDTDKGTTTTTTPPIITDERFHVVKKGETLFEVSRQHKISTVRLAELNNLPEDLSIREGQILIVKEDIVGNNNTNGGKDPLDKIGEETIYIDANGNVVKKGEAGSTNNTNTNTGNTGTMPSNALLHIVRPQENLYSIARIYKVSHQEIMVWNQLQPLDVLKVGQKLYVSDPNAKPKIDKPTSGNGSTGTGIVVVKRDPITHTVGAGETLYAISKKYGVKVGDVINWNSLNSNTPIAIGQVLKVEDPNAITEVEVKKEGGSTAKNSAPEPTYHTVKAGDDLPNIAYKYQTSVVEILRLNNMSANDMLFEDQVLLVKDVPTINNGKSIADNTDKPQPKEVAQEGVTPGSTPGTKAKTHEVKPGDTVYGLSRAYGITPDELRKWNNMTDNTLSVGKSVVVGYETVAIPKSNTGTSNTTSPNMGTGNTANNITPKTTDGPNISRARSDNSGNYIGETPAETKPVVVAPEYHIVKKGDTLYGIARTANLSVNQLKILNEGLDAQNLVIGQKIRIK